MENQEGKVILIDKPYEWTSFGVVKKLRNSLKIKKIGHAGTLDPLATGLLILCTGKMTKQIESFQNQEKEYKGEFILGKTTPSFDLETPFDQEFNIDHIREADILKTAQLFTGNIQQVPPMYSAIQVDGRRLYKKARKGEIIDIPAREVLVKSFEITTIQLPSIFFKITCSKGTYIRSLARDFGEALKAGAYLAQLRRTRIGDFKIEDASTVEAYVNMHRLQV